MQEFNTNTLICGYIQKLLRDTYIPTIPVVHDINDAPTGTFIFDSCVYCKEPNGKVRHVSDYYFGKRLLNQSTNYTPKCNYYSSDLHEALGNYLRFYRDYYGIDLMPFYNCCSNRYVETVTLPVLADGTEGSNRASVKTLAFPIRYNTFYSLKINCSSAISSIVQPVFFNGTIRLDINYYDCISNYTSFYVEPKTEDLSTERFLYLFVQLPTDSIAKSNVVVIEQGPIHISTDNTTVAPVSLVTNNTLLNADFGKQIPFSDRLIEYLLNNVIAPEVSNQHDIARVNRVFSDVIKNGSGHFTDQLHQLVYNKYRSYNLPDFNGYVDKDVEWLMFGEHNYDSGGTR